MASNPIATLDKGWVYDPETKADVALANYFASEYSQSNLYAGAISSLQYQIQQWGNDDTALRNYLPPALESYLSAYFDRVTADVKVIEGTKSGDSRMQLQVNVTVTQGGVSYSLGRLVSFLNSKIVAIMNLNNGTSTALAT